MQRRNIAVARANRSIVGLLCFVICAAFPLSGQQVPAGIQLRVEESPIGKAPFWSRVPSQEESLVVVSPDCQHIAVMSERGQPSSEQTLWVDGVKQTFPVNHWPVFSLDGRHLAYAADSGGVTGRQRFVVLDGVPGTQYEAPLLSFEYSPLNSNFIGQPVFGGADGKHLAYRATRGKRAFVVADGVEGREYDGIGRLAFSPDGQKLAYAAMRNGKSVMIGSAPEGKEEEYDAVGAPEFGADGRLAFQARREGRQFVVLDGVEGPKYAWASAPRFSPDGKHMAYLGSPDGVAMVVRGSVGRAPFLYLTCGQKCVAVMDGVERALAGPPEWPFSLSNDGTLAYSYSKGMEIKSQHESRRLQVVLGDLAKNSHRVEVAVVGGKEVAEERSKNDSVPIGPIHISPDGKRFAFAIRRSRDSYNVVNVDGSEQKSYEGVGIPVFSPDSRHVAYAAWAASRAFLVVDGVELLERSSYWPLYGPSYEIRDEGLWRSLGGVRSSIMSPVCFSGPTVMQAVQYRQDELIRVRMEIVDRGGDGH